MTALVLAADAPPDRRAAALIMLQPLALRMLDVLAMRLHDQTRQLVESGDAVFPSDVARRLKPMPVLLCAIVLSCLTRATR
ncbi:hypothetical protein ACWGE0_06540 [Lentzea sp. NPDC054927]